MSPLCEASISMPSLAGAIIIWVSLLKCSHYLRLVFQCALWRARARQTSDPSSMVRSALVNTCNGRYGTYAALWWTRAMAGMVRSALVNTCNGRYGTYAALWWTRAALHGNHLKERRGNRVNILSTIQNIGRTKQVKVWIQQGVHDI